MTETDVLAVARHNLQANITALRESQPDVADAISAAPRLEHACIGQGPDGAVAVRLSADDERVEWLGGSAMPTVSAPANLAGFAETDRNVLLPTFGTGHEVRLLLDRLAAHCCVFAYESDPAKLALGLAMVDVAESLRAGRLLLLTGMVEDALVELLAARGGYDFPAKLIHHPAVGRDGLADLTGALRRAGRAWQRRWTQLITDIARDGRQVRPDLNADSPRLLVLSIDTGEQTREQLGRIEHAARQLNWPLRACIPDHPAKVNLCARIAAVRDHRPDVLLLLNCAAGAMAAHLPADLPRICWFLESPTLPVMALDGLAAESCIMAASLAAKQTLIQRGAAKSCITIMETGVDAIVDVANADDSRQADRDLDVALLADITDTQPQAAGIDLESHARLWRQLADVVRKRIDGLDVNDLSPLLGRAESECGVRLEDDQMRRRFATLAQDNLVRSISALAAAATLGTIDATRSVFGSGWPDQGGDMAIGASARLDYVARSNVYRRSRLLILPYVDARASRFALEAIAAGCCPILNRPSAIAESNYPQSGDILRRLPGYSSQAQLRETVLRLLADDDQRQKTVAEFAERLMPAGSTVLKLREMVSHLRRVTSPPR